MRGKSIVLLVIALVCGAIASVGFTQMIRRPVVQQGPQIEMKKIFIAMKNLDVGEPLTAENVKLEDWPKDRVPEGAISELEKLDGKFARNRLVKGEPILQAKLDDKAGSRAETYIPEGYRAVAVKVSATSAVSNLILPGARVDVICYFRAGRGVSQAQTRTILKDVRVFSVNAHIDRETDHEGKTIAAKTVTLLVKPEQVEKLALAASVGNISFAMRKPNDTTDEDTEGAFVRDLLQDEDAEAGGRDLGGDDANSLLASTSTPSHSGDFLKWMQSQQSPTQPAAVVQPSGPTATMQIISPNGVKQFQWNDPKELPQEVAQASSAPVTWNNPASASTPAPALSGGASEPAETDGEVSEAEEESEPEELDLGGE